VQRRGGNGCPNRGSEGSDLFSEEKRHDTAVLDTSTSPSDSADPSTDSLPSAQLPPLLARTGIAILVTTQGTLWLEWWRRKSNLPALARGVQDSQALEYNTAKNERSRLLLI
jgi:hypothetical protein